MDEGAYILGDMLDGLGDIEIEFLPDPTGDKEDGEGSNASIQNQMRGGLWAYTLKGKIETGCDDDEGACGNQREKQEDAKPQAQSFQFVCRWCHGCWFLAYVR